ncbi:MAG: hypothetical protein V5A88_05145 [Candidatus Thermoplasmatota archaeon]
MAQRSVKPLLLGEEGRVEQKFYDRYTATIAMNFKKKIFRSVGAMSVKLRRMLNMDSEDRKSSSESDIE